MSDQIERQGLTWRHVGVVATMMLTLFSAVGIVFVAAGLCYRPVAQHFGVETSAVSLYITFVYIGSAIAPIPAARIFERVNPKVMFTICAIMVAVPYIGLSMYPEIWMFYPAGFIIGLGLACLEYTLTAGILSRWFHTNYGTVIGLSFAMTGVGGIVWNFVGQFILGVDLSGWTTLYQSYGICIAVLTIVPILLFIRRTPEEVGLLPYGMPLNAEDIEEEEVVEEPGLTLKESVKLPFFWTMLLGAGLLNIVTTMSQLFSTYVQFLGHDGWGGEAIVALLLLSGTLESCASAGQMIGKILVGIIESRSLLAAQIMGVCGGICGLLMIWQFPKQLGEGGIYLMFAGGAVYGLMYACSTAMLPFLVRECFGGKEYDRIYSIQVAIFNILGGIGATAWTVIMQTYGWDTFFIFAMCEVIVTFICIAYTGIAAYKYREKTWYQSDAQLAAEGANA